MRNDAKDLLLNQQKNFFYSTIIKLIIAGLMCLGGFVLLVLGISGSIEIVVNAVDVQGKLVNASPGIIFVFLGMFIIIKTHHKTQQEIEQDEKGVIRRATGMVEHGIVMNPKDMKTIKQKKYYHSLFDEEPRKKNKN